MMKTESSFDKLRMASMVSWSNVMVSLSNHDGQLGSFSVERYSFPFVEGTPLTLLSIDVAISNALANALNIASKM